ncbi:MAG TPA: ornithine cyclodeaminase family protein [Streptosporangiaceae bacterium]|nr:ornithine cyclodeaminase family protein [Streptosporangiaceae bacterium]
MTKLLVLSGHAVREVLGYRECADAMRDALIARANGEVFQPLRSVLKPPGAPGLMAVMPAYQQGQAAGYGLKAITITPGNPALGLDTHQGIVLLSSSETGQPLAVLNASAVTEIRTAAVSVIATEILASADADVLAIIGTGVQASSHLRALSSTRKLAEIRVAGRTTYKAARFAATHAAQAGGTKLVASPTVEQAIAGAGIVVTATNSAAPVINRDWLSPGTHLNAVGACLPDQRELDTATVASAALYGDSRESVIAEAGDYVLAAAEGAIGPDHLKAELGDLLAAKPGAQGRAGEREITIFESLGLAVEDLAAAALAYDTARARGIGTLTDFE